MTKEDRKEVVEMIKSVVEPLVKSINKGFENQAETFKTEIELLRGDFKIAIQEQSTTFLKVLNAYEKRSDQHEQKFKNIKKAVE